MTDLRAPILEESVRDCLAHLYDYPFLQDHPLVRMLVPNVQGSASRVQVFQQLVLSAIDRLKPHDVGNAQTKNSRLYSILSLRYQQQQQVQYILRQLNLGERQFYRDYAKAVQALTHIFEELMLDLLPNEGSVAAAIPAPVPSTHGDQAHAPRQRDRVQARSIINAEVFFQNILVAIKGLSDRRCSTVEVQCLETILPGSVDQTCLRQVVIWIVSQLLMQSPTGSHIVITFEIENDTARVTFSRQRDPSQVGGSQIVEERHKTLESLLDTLRAQVYDTQQGDRVATVLEVPVQQHSVLIIDDNPDVMMLFRQYLSGQEYQIYTAYDGVQALALAREMRPKVILLDVLLPNQDGWDILRHLKNHPATIDTPIVICSVMDVSDLAIMLGADGFLLKPPPEHEFLDTVKRFLQ